MLILNLTLFAVLLSNLFYIYIISKFFNIVKINGGQGWIRTTVDLGQGIYSPPQLTVLPPTHYDAYVKNNRLIKYIIVIIKIGNISLSFITFTLFNKNMVSRQGFEPRVDALEGHCIIQLC